MHAALPALYRFRGSKYSRLLGAKLGGLKGQISSDRVTETEGSQPSINCNVAKFSSQNRAGPSPLVLLAVPHLRALGRSEDPEVRDTMLGGEGLRRS